MGLHQDLIKGRSKNVRIFGGAPENDEINIGKVRDPKLEEEKAKGFNMQVGYGDFQNNGIFNIAP